MKAPRSEDYDVRRGGLDTPRKSSRGNSRRRGAATGLRKSGNVDNVIVAEDPFYLILPQNDTSDANKAGEGCYISATVQNKRYYGVLIDQKSLKEASDLWFKDEASSLDLNRRMKILKSQQTQQEEQLQEECEDSKLSSEASLPRSTDTVGLNADDTANGTVTETTVSDQKETSLNVSNSEENELKRPLPGDDERDNKRSKLGEGPKSVTYASPSTKERILPSEQFKMTQPDRQVQKFRYVQQNVEDPGYRILLATYVNVLAAAGDDKHLAQAIQKACDEGGQFVENDCYYQYEVLGTTLGARYQTKRTKEYGIRSSMGFHSFLHNTVLPEWYPLANLQLGQQRKVLNMLKMKRDHSGNAVQQQISSSTPTDTIQPSLVASSGNADAILSATPSIPSDDMLMITSGTYMPMKPRTKPRFQIGVIGGGIAGLSCCQELIRSMEQNSIDGQVTLLEARSRLGGRLWTDATTFSSHPVAPTPAQSIDGPDQSHSESSSFPVDLGASWIHGIDHNPLAALAKEAGIDFVSTSEEVQMLGINLQEVDADVDEEMGKLFDELLDLAADDCWSAPEEATTKDSNAQSAVRWYSSVLVDPSKVDVKTSDRVNGSGNAGTSTPQIKNEGDGKALKRPHVESMSVPRHRQSSDRSVDCEIGKAIAKHKFREFSKLGDEEHRMLLFYTKNVEYALGANIADLSMKFWASDEKHAFDGAHVLLKQGYSTVVQHILSKLQAAGEDRFQCVLDFPVGKVEYARKSTTLQHLPSVSPMSDGFGQPKLIEMSDTCAVKTMDGSETKYFDFLVCAVPLGVLKESIAKVGSTADTDIMEFQPCLPFSKMDAITQVGFGLLDKVYLQFPFAFWRLPCVFKEDNQILFGNATGINPHHYMFHDVGKALAMNKENSEAPPILMSLVSGKEAVACECLSDDQLIDEVMDTLNAIFASKVTVPRPSAYRITRWGQDKFARGSYVFLPPGATDQDFQVLQSPINGNGDSLLLDETETMRLFFAGEHTSALHPSMAHGAMLSGIRAAKEVLSTMKCSSGSTARESKDVDRIIPVSLFRHNNPNAPLRCSFCHKIGSQVREGSLLAFKRGAREVLAHDNCAEYSPEVEVRNGRWKHVIKAVNRGKFLKCTLCHQIGATIGCSAEGCLRVFHHSCAEDTGFRFDRDGKVFYCDLHRRSGISSDCDRISIKFYLSKHHISALHCFFCGLAEENDATVGKLLAFQQVHTSHHNNQTLQFRQACVHERCARFSNIVDTAEIKESRIGHEYRGIFKSLEKSRMCAACNRRGATVRCLDPSCNSHFHVPCCIRAGWNFEKRNGSHFKCLVHRDRKPTNGTNGGPQAGFFHHNLLSQFGATSTAPRVNIPSNQQIGSLMGGTVDDVKDETSDSGDSHPEQDELESAVLDKPLSCEISGMKRLIRIERKSRDECWKLSLAVEENEAPANASEARNLLVVASCGGGKYSLKAGDTIISMNGMKIGSTDLKTLRLVLSRLKQEVDLMMEVVRELT